MIKVYLAGYMHGTPCYKDYFDANKRKCWRHELRELMRVHAVSQKVACDIEILEPGVPPGSVPGQGRSQIYAARDELCLQKCDLVVAYFDIQTARCLGVASEVGYAKALNKPVIFVNANYDTAECSSLDLCRAWSNAEWHSLLEAAEHLVFISKL